MLYKKNTTKTLDKSLFKNPTSEYRGAPFWAWNCSLDKDELMRQIDCLKEMGFGGFHIHSRSGMATEYLGDDFMELVKSCVEKGEENDMLTYLYDEDRWPSGYGGGFVTQTIAYRQKRLRFTVNEIESGTREEFITTGKACLIACFDIVLDSDGFLESYDVINTSDTANGTKWYVYMEIPKPLGRFNNQTYVDPLFYDAMHKFIEVTHESYKKAIGDKFGRSVNSIFTDEPQVPHKEGKKFSHDKNDAILAWTYDFDTEYQKIYGDDIIPHLPELIWELKKHAPSLARYRYHDYVCERITTAFLDQCGEWCENNGILFTGHVMGEGTLFTQTKVLGEAMRAYRKFTLPGIDMLCNDTEYATAKQCQSAVHQFGREGMLSEMYGVTGYNFDFRGHKFQGDWQAAMGVTLRVPHLSWVSMKGSAKRDYPASISYQSPWYTEYSYIENHFARLNTVLTRGKPVVKVGVIHPIESMWLNFGPADLTSDICNALEKSFSEITETLLFGTIDFDYISESLMPELYRDNSDALLHIGKMSYDVVIIPAMQTMRRSTLEILNKFKKSGGKIIFRGDCPSCIDALPCTDATALYENSIHTNSSFELLNELSNERIVSIKDENGSSTDNLIYTMRSDNGIDYLFIAHGKNDNNPDISHRQSLTIKVKGSYRVDLLDTMSGEICDVIHHTNEGYTLISCDLYNNDSLLLQLTPVQSSSFVKCTKNKDVIECLRFFDKVKYERTEPNVLLLDIAQLSFDGVNFEEKEEILRIDDKLRRQLNFPLATGLDVQPWYIKDEQIKHFPYLRFIINSEIEAACRLAYEEVNEIILNGEKVKVEKHENYVDVNIFTTPLPKLRIGENELILRIPFGKRYGLENFYLLGDFEVNVSGCKAVITQKSDIINFGSIIHQGMPFYGGNLIYETNVKTPVCDLKLKLGQYRGALVKVSIDNIDYGVVALAPYEKEIYNLSSGEHTIKLTLFGNRNNTFGALHNCDPNWKWFGPRAWYTTGDEWSYEYRLSDIGLLTSPVIEIYPV